MWALVKSLSYVIIQSNQPVGLALSIVLFSGTSKHCAGTNKVFRGLVLRQA